MSLDEEDVQKLVDEKIQERKEEWKKEAKQELREEIKRENRDEKKEREEKEISRRSFLKKAGLGTAGLAAMAMSPASALDIRSDNLRFYDGLDSSDLQLEITSDGNLDLQGNSLVNADVELDILDHDTVDKLANAEAGSAIAIGDGVTVEDESRFSIAIGNDGTNIPDNSERSVVIGSSIDFDTNEGEFAGFGSVSIGSQQFHDLPDDGTTFVALGNAVAIDSSDAIGIGSGTSVKSNSKDGIAIGNDASIGDSSPRSIAIGGNEDSISSGADIGDNSKSSIAFGHKAKVEENTDSAIAIGDSAEATNPREGHINIEQLRFGAVEGTIPEEDLGESELTFEIDEDNNELVATIKESDGTVRSGTVFSW